jgi:putative endopeptidase
MPDQAEFHAWQPAAVTGLAALVGSETLQTWQDWLTFHRINTATSVLPKAFDDSSFAFYGTTLNGTPAQRARDKRGIAAVNAALGDAVGQAYVARHFPPSSRTQIEAMVKNILAAFDKRVAGLD